MLQSRTPKIENPELFDRIIVDIQQHLSDSFLWLNRSFGRAERLVKMINGKRYYTPNVYAGGNEYLNVSPDSKLGNFSFFTIEDPQNVIWETGYSEWKTEFSIIFWFDMRTITNEANNRNIQLIKSQILKSLNEGLRLSVGRIKIKKVYEKAENIYSGFTLDEIDNQFLMHPYAGLKFVGDMEINQPCL